MARKMGQSIGKRVIVMTRPKWGDTYRGTLTDITDITITIEDVVRFRDSLPSQNAPVPWMVIPWSNVHLIRPDEEAPAVDPDLCPECHHEPVGGYLRPEAAKDCQCWCHEGGRS